MRHACLILAHNEFGLLQTLVSCLDDARNDIFVHFDKKVAALPDLRVEKSGLYILEDRVDVRWGDWSMLEAEYKLFETARKQGGYTYYHLLSGVDLPLKSQDYIHEFFSANAGKQFIGYTLSEMTPELVKRMQYWHLFPEDFKNKSLIKRVLRAGCLYAQMLLGIKRNKEIEFKKGSQWVSITESLVDYLLEKKAWAQQVFTHTFCPDESVIQTLCWQSPERENIYNAEDDALGCMRAIGWRDGQLIDWCSKDLETLRDSSALFARKFNSSDPNFINEIVKLSR